MTRLFKTQLLEELVGEFSKAQAVIACDYRGLSVQNIELLRSMARSKGVKVKVVKNTLAKMALEKVGVKLQSLKGLNVFIWSDDQINTSKVYADFAKAHESFIINASVAECQVVDSSVIETLSKLPGRDELLGMLLSVWIAPARNFAVGLDNLRQSKE